MMDQAAVLRRMVGQKTRPTRVVAVTSGKGGVGKSNLTANLGISLARLGARPAIVDGDLGMANIGILLGITPRYDLRDVLAGQCRMSDIGEKGPEGLLLFAGGSGLYDVANPTPAQLEKLLEALAGIEQLCDFLLVDTGAGISEAVIRLVLSAAEVVLVTTPEPPAIADAYGMIKVIARRSPQTRVHVVVNMVRQSGDGPRVYAGLKQAASHFLQFDLEFLGEVPQDPAVQRAVLEQKPVVLAYPQSGASKAVEKVAQSLLGVSTPTAGGWRGLLKRMWGGRR